MASQLSARVAVLLVTAQANGGYMDSPPTEGLCRTKLVPAHSTWALMQSHRHRRHVFEHEFVEVDPRLHVDLPRQSRALQLPRAAGGGTALRVCASQHLFARPPQVASEMSAEPCLEPEPEPEPNAAAAGNLAYTAPCVCLAV
jgi:hypothetical protein